MKNKKLLIIVIGILLLGFFAFIIFNAIGKKDSSNNDNSNEKDSALVKEKAIDWNLGEQQEFQIIIDLKLTEKLADQNFIFNVFAYDKDDKLVHEYKAYSYIYDLSGQDVVHLSYTDNESDDCSNIASVKVDVLEDTMDRKPLDEYRFIQYDEVKVVQYLALYRVFLDLDEWYLRNSGLAVLKYSDNSINIVRISYLGGTDYIGVAFEEDFSIVSGAALESIDVYQTSSLSIVE